MKTYLRLALICSLTLAMMPAAYAQETARLLSETSNTASINALNSDEDKDKNKNKTAKKDGKSETNPTTTADKTAEAASINDPLIKLLVTKGVLSVADANTIGGGSPADQRDKLATLLLQKGLISNSEFETIRVVSPIQVNAAPTTTESVAAIAPQETVKPQPTAAQPNAQPTAAAFVPAVAPIRVLQLEGTKRDGLIPDIKLGNGAKIKLYGFYKTSVVHNTSNPHGNDFPLPGFIQDSGPDGAPAFFLKVRGFRFGANFEWLDPLPKVTLTGKVELDFEGDFPRANSRNIASLRAVQPNLRSAWMRIDYANTERLSTHVLFGQDWTPFASSTNPNTIETTGFHLGYGNIYQRLPQVRVGANYLLNKKNNIRIQPEVAITLPLFGNLPLNVGDQLGFGERQGTDSQRPEIQGRLVFQFQLDKAPGVAPAQLITSFTQAKRKAIIPRGNVPGAFLGQFGSGATVDSERYGYSAEFQLPTRIVTAVGKYYKGADLRGYFSGQLFSVYNDTAGLNGVVTAPSIDGSATVAFGCLVAYTVNCPLGQGVVADQNPVRVQGGFINLGFPLGRIFGVDPKSRLAGLQAYLHYGFEEADPRDVRRFNGSTLGPTGLPVQSLGANRTFSDIVMGSLQYKINSYVTFAYEQSYLRTRAANQVGALPLFRGIPSRSTQNLRSEFATIFTF